MFDLFRLLTLDKPTEFLEQAGDGSDDFRRQTYMLLGFATGPFILPFAFYSGFVGRYVMLVILVFIAILAWHNSMSIKRTGLNSVPFGYFFLAQMAGLVWSMVNIGPQTAYWAYPIIVLTSFIPARREARGMVGLSLIVCIATAAFSFAVEFATRFAVTLLMLAFFSDLIIGVLDDLQRRMAEQAATDPLTGAYNRRTLLRSLGRLIETHRPGRDERVSLIAMDIDHFKPVNDKYGHDAGDRVLKEVVALIQSRLEPGDTIYRTGGEEFVILLRHVRAEQGVGVAESLRWRIEKAEFADQLKITVSMGVAHFRANQQAEAWLRRADRCLYEAKNLGRNRVISGCDDGVGELLADAGSALP